MPGAFPHLIAGCAMFIIGRYFFKDYFSGNDKVKEQILLAVVCLSFSILPDFFLAIYYTTHIYPFDSIWPLHSLTHIIFLFFALLLLLILTLKDKIKKKPIWIIGMWCIILHVTMDFLIPDVGIWI